MSAREGTYERPGWLLVGAFRTVHINFPKEPMAQSIRAQLAAVIAAITKLEAKRDELKVKAENEINFDDVKPGRIVSFPYGKGDGKKTLTGPVLGVKAPNVGEKGPTLVRVAVGSGFDAQIVTVFLTQVESIQPLPVAEDNVPADEATTPAAE